MDKSITPSRSGSTYPEPTMAMPIGWTDGCFRGIILGVPEQDVVVWVHGPSWGNSNLRIIWAVKRGTRKVHTKLVFKMGTKWHWEIHCFWPVPEMPHKPLDLSMTGKIWWSLSVTSISTWMGFFSPSWFFMDYLYKLSEQWDGGVEGRASCNSDKGTEKEILEPERHRRLTLLNHTFTDGRKKLDWFTDLPMAGYLCYRGNLLIDLLYVRHCSECFTNIYLFILLNNPMK